MTAVMDKLPATGEAWNEKVFQALLTGGLACLGFFLLYATAGTAIAMFILALAGCFAPVRIWRQQPWRQPLLAWGLLLLAYILLRSVLGDGLAGIRPVNQYQELLLLPLLWALLRLARRPQAFTHGLVAGAVVAALAIVLTDSHFFRLLPAPLNKLQDILEHSMRIRRISMGFGLSVCAYLLYEHVRLGRFPRLPGYALALFLVATVLFFGEGRTGYLVLLVLIGCAAYRAGPRRWRLPVAAAFVIGSILVASLSAQVRTRVEETVNVLQGVGPMDETTLSTRTRIELARNGLEVARENWLLGTGWVHYADVYRAVALARHPDQPELAGSRSDNPHDEYLLQLGAGGLPSLLLFLAWLAWPMWRAVREGPDRNPWTGVAGSLAIAFAVGALFNSLLRDFAEAHLYVALMAWLLVRRIDRA